MLPTWRFKGVVFIYRLLETDLENLVAPYWKYEQYMAFIWRNHTTICKFLWKVSSMVDVLGTSVEIWECTYPWFTSVPNQVLLLLLWIGLSSRGMSLLKRQWSLREALISRQINITTQPLVNLGNVFLPSLRFKLDLMKNFSKAVVHNAIAFLYMKLLVLRISLVKRETIFVGS
jgi:hypothetical protein